MPRGHCKYQCTIVLWRLVVGLGGCLERWGHMLWKLTSTSEIFQNSKQSQVESAQGDQNANSFLQDYQGPFTKQQ